MHFAPNICKTGPLKCSINNARTRILAGRRESSFIKVFQSSSLVSSVVTKFPESVKKPLEFMST
jgi:hypothetical protein